jgi:hypothetical protein
MEETLAPRPNFNRPVQDLVYNDLLTSTFTQASHDRGNLFRVKTRVCSYNLYTTHFCSYHSQFTLVKLIKLKRTQSVCAEKERKGKGTRGKTERK